MKRLLFLAAAIAPCLLSSPARAMTVDEVVDRCIRAQGGIERLHALKSMRVAGKSRWGEGDFSIELTVASVATRSGHLRSEATWQGMTGVDAWDGHDGWRTE